MNTNPRQQFRDSIPKPPTAKERPCVHGPVFKLTAPSRLAVRSATVLLAGQDVRLATGHGLHRRKLPALVGMVLRVKFLKADDTVSGSHGLCYLFIG